MENNLLYKSASIHAERNDYKNRYGADAAILGKEDFVISEIEIDYLYHPLRWKMAFYQLNPYSVVQLICLVIFRL